MNNHDLHQLFMDIIIFVWSKKYEYILVLIEAT